MSFETIEVAEQIQKFIKDFLKNNGFKGVVVGVSGGVDSAVVATLCTKALGKERLLALIFPERDSSKESTRLALKLCRHLGVEHRVVSITPVLRKMGVYRLFPPASLFPRKVQENYVKGKWMSLSKDPYLDDLLDKGNETFKKGLAYYRIKHRVRMCLLYFEAEKRSYAVAGCVNKTELMTGLYVKWGDSAADFEPIAHLYKTQVLQLARWLEVPSEIVERVPTPDLIPGITDEFVLGLSYEDLDRILMKIEKQQDLSGEDPKLVQRVRQACEAALHRRIRNVRIDSPDGV
ncbi:MAG: NH(3)-dependent NAD(+) synthetase [Thermotoga sp. 50_1627]|uniref:NAD(+) synthase n=1 Tax=Pseudothermotoga sp. TaxID=2033661 RepID=UPI00076C814A|nr:MAG: NH(3)-dependent NAD(+) synthetase [Thermotoga sp. 50_64]KUK25582.1 MAG: NH(3)-dependent NAD(+) synthetase [Thermotoga sp. 50_1627]MBC7116607.1 NAD(+) synthase [Pseudothermotoga sp.]MDK2922618.1 synthase [Pseudothermotoga sp.]HBT40281.1 NAD(+) synthetase [Pseudothermotoga sp.]